MWNDASMHFAQLTDTHVTATSDPANRADAQRRVRRAVQLLNAEEPQIHAVLATGDLTSDGHTPEYAVLAECLADLGPRLLPIPGNHDTRDGIRGLAPDLPWADAEHASWMVDHDGVTIIGLDTTKPGHQGAEFDAERAQWLDQCLTTASALDRPILLTMHHPPFLSGLTWMDQSGFDGLAQFREIIDPHRIDRIICGHLHRPVNAMVAGTIAQVGLSLINHVALNFTPKSELWVVNEPVGYQIYRGSWISTTAMEWVVHTRYLEDTEAPTRLL